MKSEPVGAGAEYPDFLRAAQLIVLCSGMVKDCFGDLGRVMRGE
jgi:hypothetical protein